MSESALMKTQRRLQEADDEARRHAPCIICEAPIRRHHGERSKAYWNRLTCSTTHKNQHLRNIQAARGSRRSPRDGNVNAPKPVSAAIKLIDRYLRWPVHP